MRTFLRDDHLLFRDQVQRFIDARIQPFYADWERDGLTPAALWREAGEQGLLCCALPPPYGPGGDFGHALVVIEALARANCLGIGFSIHSDMVAPYLYNLGTPAQKDRWLPAMAAGELIGAIAMTEPGTGSDLQAVRTTAMKEGEHYRINGSKTFITNGQLANLVIVVCKTDKDQGAQGMSLLVVETDQVQGFRRGRNLDKLGMDAQDTSELFFDDVLVPATNLLGGHEGQGFVQLMQELPQERLIVAFAGIAAMELAMQETLAYTKERKAFGKPIFAFQNTRFKLAECQALLMASRALVDAAMVAHLKGELGVDRAALIKYWITDNQCKLIDECLQLFGGYGYMKEYPIARLYADARVQRIYGGTNEIMKELASRFL